MRRRDGKLPRISPIGESNFDHTLSFLSGTVFRPPFLPLTFVSVSAFGWTLVSYVLHGWLGSAYFAFSLHCSLRGCGV